MTNNQAYATMFTVMNNTPHYNKKPKNNKEKEPSFTRKVFSADPKYAHIGLEAKEVAYARRLLTGLVLAGVALGGVGFAKNAGEKYSEIKANNTPIGVIEGATTLKTDEGIDGRWENLHREARENAEGQGATWIDEDTAYEDLVAANFNPEKDETLLDTEIRLNQAPDGEELNMARYPGGLPDNNDGKN